VLCASLLFNATAINEADMTIKHLGGIFGRNPTFEDVTIEGNVKGDLQVTGSVQADTHFTSVDGAATLSTSGSGGIVYFRPNGRGDISGQVRVLDNGNVSLLDGSGLDFSDTSSGMIWRTGTGTPEGVVVASVGSLYTRSDGGAGTTLYVKESGTGNTGWVAK